MVYPRVVLFATLTVNGFPPNANVLRRLRTPRRFSRPGRPARASDRITSYNVCYTKLLRLAAANFLEGRDIAKSAQAYHQAGYQLHRLELFTQAGRAYSNAGRLAERVV